MKLTALRGLSNTFVFGRTFCFTYIIAAFCDCVVIAFLCRCVVLCTVVYCCVVYCCVPTNKTRLLLNISNPSGHYMYHQFNIQQFYVLPTQCIYVFCVDLRTNSDYFTVQH